MGLAGAGHKKEVLSVKRVNEKTKRPNSLPIIINGSPDPSALVLLFTINARYYSAQYGHQALRGNNSYSNEHEDIDRRVLAVDTVTHTLYMNPLPRKVINN